jgi:non-specific protein-tyrosine kinase
MALFNEKSPQAEAFRYLRTRISALDHGTPPQKLLVTSAEPGEGKSTVTANLAVAIGRSGLRVIAVDADLRLPTLHTIFGLSNEVGLGNVLSQEAILDEAVQDSDIPGIWVLTSGPSPPSPAELLGSPQMSALIEQLAEQFDVVLIDTPSLLAVVDATELVSTANGVVLVVARALARREAVKAACQLLEEVKAELIGTVVNRAGQNRRYDYYSRAAARRRRRVPNARDLAEG